MTKSNFLENKHLEGLPLTSTNHAPSAAYSNPISWVSQEALGPRLLSTCAESAPGASSFGPELPRKKCFSPAPRGMTARAVSVLNQDAAQSKWLKYQTIPQANSVESDVTAAASGMDVSCTGTRMLDSAHGSWIDTLCLQRIQGTLHDQQQVGSSKGLVSGRRMYPLHISEIGGMHTVSGESACNSTPWPQVRGPLRVSGHRLSVALSQPLLTAELVKSY